MNAPLFALAVAAAMSGSCAAAAEPLIPDFNPAEFDISVANPYFPLELGPSRTLAAREGEADSYTVMTIVGPGPIILGVETTALLDEVFESGRIVERTRDYYASDRHGNVWYFGEDVTNYRYDEAGKLIGTDDESAWRAGVNGAAPGIQMPADPQLDVAVFQEHAPAEEAMDYAVFVELDAKVTTPAGTFEDVYKAFESSTAEPDARGFKYWAPGYGLIREDEGLSEDLDAPEAVIELQP
jgi:hypothetical protein